MLELIKMYRIEDTQRLWQKFLADFARFGEWLYDCEFTVSQPNTQFVTYQDAREELRNYEVCLAFALGFALVLVSVAQAPV